jgi:dTDP-4-amino-4,6-dideoxygalactose transaminase
MLNDLLQSCVNQRAISYAAGSQAVTFLLVLCEHYGFRKADKSRNELLGLLNAEGIGTSVHYPVALPHSKYYSQKYPIAKDKFSQAQHLAANTISLPCGPHVSDQDIGKIIEKMNEILNP